MAPAGLGNAQAGLGKAGVIPGQDHGGPGRKGLDALGEHRVEQVRDAFSDYEPLTDELVDQISIDQLRKGSISPELLLDKGWMLFETTSAHPFITSDNPVVRLNNRAMKERWPRGSKGLRSPFVEIFFPLTPLHCLSLVSNEHVQEIRQGFERILAMERMRPESAFELWPARAVCESLLDDLESGRAHQVAPEVVMNINSGQCFDCMRQVYSAFPDFSLAKQMKNDGCFEEGPGGTWVTGDEWNAGGPSDSNPSSPDSTQGE